MIMSNYIVIAIFLVLPNIFCESVRVRRSYDHDYTYDNPYRIRRHGYKGRMTKSQFYGRSGEGGGEMGLLESSSPDGQNPTDEGMDSVMVYTPAFDRYNLNEMEIAIAQTLYLMIVPEIQNAVDFKMTQILNQYLQAPWPGSLQNARPPHPVPPPRPLPGVPPFSDQVEIGPSESSLEGGSNFQKPIIPVWEYTRPENLNPQSNTFQTQQGQKPQEPPQRLPYGQQQQTHHQQPHHNQQQQPQQQQQQTHPNLQPQQQQQPQPNPQQQQQPLPNQQPQQQPQPNLQPQQQPQPNLQPQQQPQPNLQPQQQPHHNQQQQPQQQQRPHHNQQKKPQPQPHHNQQPQQRPHNNQQQQPQQQQRPHHNQQQPQQQPHHNQQQHQQQGQDLQQQQQQYKQPAKKRILVSFERGPDEIPPQYQLL